LNLADQEQNLKPQRAQRKSAEIAERSPPDKLKAQWPELCIWNALNVVHICQQSNRKLSAQMTAGYFTLDTTLNL
jgi:hypothetical protein